MTFQGVLGPYNFKLWKEMEVLFNGARCLCDVFEQDVDNFIVVHVTPFAAKHCKDPFMSCAESRPHYRPELVKAILAAAEVEMAEAILVPFERIPTTLDQLRGALNSKLLRKLPIALCFWDELETDEAAKEVFEVETAHLGQTSCLVSAAWFDCFKRYEYYGYRDMYCARGRRSLWHTVFCRVWDCLYRLAGIQSGVLEYIYSDGSSRSDLSLLVHGKEILYFEEDPGEGTDAEHLARREMKRLDPYYYKGMQHMVRVSTKVTRFRVSAGGDSDDDEILIDDQIVELPNGFSTAIKTCINLMRYARHGLQSCKTLPGKKSLSMNDSKEEFVNE